MTRQTSVFDLVLEGEASKFKSPKSPAFPLIFHF